MVKGLKSMWRQAPPVVRTTLHGVLLRIVMQVLFCQLILSTRPCTPAAAELGLTLPLGQQGLS